MAFPRGRHADRSGQVFGLVTVVERRGDDEFGYPLYLVRCTCGVERVTRVDWAKGREPTTHIACSKAKWAEREKAIRAAR